MKKISFFLFFLVVAASLYSQVPEGFSYQAAVRNELGQPIFNRAVTFHFSILVGNPFGIQVYEENHFINTDVFGNVALIIGDGVDKSGTFETIEWGSDKYFLNVGLDTLGGLFFSDMGTSQFLSVPYSLFAKEAGNVFSGDYNDLVNIPITDGSETKIKQGINISVTGAGTISDPYTINSETSLVAGDNMLVTGSGTSVDPYIVSERIHYIGESYGGGIVFYVYDNGRHGLIASKSDQDPGIEWSNGIKRYTNTTGEGIGAGEMNTTLIIALQTNDNPMGNFSAKVCADYSVTVDGVTYGDWYLPSISEISLLFNASALVGGFANNYYWSSTEFSSVSSWGLDFSIGSKDILNKGLQYGVRAIRRF